MGGSKQGVSQSVMLQQSSMSSLTPSPESAPPQLFADGSEGEVVDMNLFRTILGRCFNLKRTRARAARRRRRTAEVTARETTRMLRPATLTLSKGTTSRSDESGCSWHLSPDQPAGQKHSGAPSTTLQAVECGRQKLEQGSTSHREPVRDSGHSHSACPDSLRKQEAF